jgi:hypothetical protein
MYGCNIELYIIAGVLLGNESGSFPGITSSLKPDKATKGKLPEATDPNVLLLKDKLEMEAEDATFLGNIHRAKLYNFFKWQTGYTGKYKYQWSKICRDCCGRSRPIQPAGFLYE